MNTTSLAKLYDRLSPRERLPLIVAASGRGDQVEADRLLRSAPRIGYALPDYFGLADGVQNLALFHLLELLDLAAMYWRVSAAQADAESSPGKEGKVVAARLLATKRMFAFLFTVEADAWKQFCAEMQLDGELLLRGLPGYANLDLTEEEARRSAYSQEEATAWVRRKGNSTEEAVTVEAVVASMQEMVTWRAGWWGQGVA
jgi:hypothetical protein